MPHRYIDDLPWVCGECLRTHYEINSVEPPLDCLGDDGRLGERRLPVVALRDHAVAPAARGRDALSAAAVTYVHAYTAFSWFEQCPEKFAWRWVDGNREADTPESAAGRAAHEALQDRIERARELPLSLTGAEPMVRALERRGAVATELQLAIDCDFEPTGFFSRTAWLRGVLDVFLRRSIYAFVGDWKTGKRREDDLQLMIFATLALKTFPELDTVHTVNLWLREGKPGVLQTWHRDQLPDMLARIIQHAQAIEDAMKSGNFPKRQGPLCKWCPNTGCEFNRRAA